MYPMHAYIKYWRFARNTLSETKIQKIYTPKRNDEHPRLFHMGLHPRPPPGLTSVKRRLLQVSVPAFQSQSLKIVCSVGSC